MFFINLIKKINHLNNFIIKLNKLYYNKNIKLAQIRLVQNCIVIDLYEQYCQYLLRVQYGVGFSKNLITHYTI